MIAQPLGMISGIKANVCVCGFPIKSSHKDCHRQRYFLSFGRPIDCLITDASTDTENGLQTEQSTTNYCSQTTVNSSQQLLNS